MKKTCPRCGKSFICKLDDTCWCNNYKIPAKLLRDIEKTYKDCLCENCIKELGAKNIAN